jgi:hypothetical protein
VAGGFSARTAPELDVMFMLVCCWNLDVDVDVDGGTGSAPPLGNVKADN